MKNWIKYMILPCLLLTALLAWPSASAEAGLTAKQTDVDVTLHLPEGKTETITSLRFALRVSAESGSMDAPVFRFHSGISSMVKDAAVTKQKDGSYLVDLILAGKKDQKIFSDSEDAAVGTVSVKPASKEYRIKVEYADTALRYADAGGISEMTASLEDEAAAVVESQKQAQVQAPAAKPALKASRKNYNYVSFKWGKIAGADGYRIYRYDSKTKKYKSIKTITNSKTTAFSKKYSYAKTYSFKMRAFKLKADGTKLFGPYSSVVKVTLAPAQVKSFSAKVKARKVKLSWKKVSGAKGYRIYRSEKKNGIYKLVKTIKKGKTTNTTVKYKTGKKYYYKVRAYVTNSKKNRVYGKYSKAKKA